MASKQEIREEVLGKRRALTTGQIVNWSEKIARSIEKLPEYPKAKIAASYVAKKDEVQTREILESMLRKGKQVIVPRSNPIDTSLVFHEIHSFSDLKIGNFGVLEPSADSPIVSLSNADLVLVPVVAWDANGSRLGYGKGYFDRELGSLGKGITIGLAFEMQRRSTLPVTSLDIQLDMIITELRVLRFRKIA